MTRQTAELARDLTVNGVVQQYPATLEVFRRHGIDSCCGGALPVSEAAQRHGVDADELWAELLHTVNR